MSPVAPDTPHGGRQYTQRRICMMDIVIRAINEPLISGAIAQAADRF